MSRSPVRSPGAAHDGDALSALLATEHALRERLDAASEEARRMVDDARARAAAAERELDANAAREIAALDAAHEQALRIELAGIAERARADASRFDAVPDARVRELAARAVARLLGA
jgi:vacuolar-type H+-ATPase subunit H